jgi:hypothetical protein
MLHTPVALILFNRPATTERVFAEIARAKPTKLFLIADGPRQGRPGDIEQCAAARAIAERVDWNCEVVKNYSDVNLGCGRRPATGISWVFEQVDRAIILEDDCVPDPTFFAFCDELLEKYHSDSRVMMVAGFNSLPNHSSYSYFFCYQHANFGGWATWRRACRHFDLEIKLWPRLRETTWLQEILEDPRAVEHWARIFDRAYAAAGSADYWDYQWTFALWAERGLAITPRVNLIKNIGFGEDATHTTSPNDSRLRVARRSMQFPLIHPPDVVRDKEADRAVVARMVARTLSKDSRSWVRRKVSTLVPAYLKEQVRRFAYYRK